LKRYFYIHCVATINRKEKALQGHPHMQIFMKDYVYRIRVSKISYGIQYIKANDITTCLG